MDILESGEIDCLVRKSGLAIKSNQSTDRKGKFKLLEQENYCGRGRARKIIVSNTGS
jgi:hypothetical protein